MVGEFKSEQVGESNRYTWANSLGILKLARPVKIADLRDNLNRTRLAVLPAGKRDNLLAKYDGALSLLDR